MIRVAALGWLAGALLLVGIDRLPPAWVASAWVESTWVGWLWMAAAASVAGWMLYRLRRSRWRLLGVFGVALALGFAVTGRQASQRLNDRLAPLLENRTLTLTGTVAGIVDTARSGSGPARRRFEFLPVRPPAGVPSRLRLTWRQADPSASAPAPGELWRVEVRLKPPRGLRNPGTFDYERWLFTQGIGATGYVRAAERLTTAGFTLDGLRGELADAVAQRVDPEVAGVLAAITVGDRRYLTDAERHLLRATGTSHLVAISGLHVSLIAGFVYGALRLSRRLCRRRTPAACGMGGVRSATVAALVVAVGYAALAGFSLPTQRALIMLWVLFGARLLARPLTWGQGMALALLAVLLWSPLAVLAPGFWLSFVAVAALFYIALGERGSWLKRIVWTQLAVFLGLLPVLAFWFGAVPLWSPLINAVAIPLFGVLVIPTAVAGVVLLPWFAPLGGVCLVFAGWVVAAFWRAVSWCAQGPVELEWAVAQAPLGVYLWALPGLLLLCLPRPVRPTLAGLTLYLPLLTLTPPKPSEGEVWVTFMDVGLGAAVLVQTHDHALLYDAGPRYRSGFDTGEAVVAPLLRARGVTALDRIIISHDDIDHAGGLSAVLAAFPAAPVMAAAPISGFSGVVEYCRRGASWRWDEVHFTVLHPPAGYVANDNNGSCVLRVATASAAVLLTGDIQRRAERDLLAALPRHALAAAVVQVPHHGSATSSSAAFVQAVRPVLGVVSTAFKNRYDFPKPTVRQRYQSMGTNLYITGELGAVTLRVLADGTILVDADRTARRRLWQWYPP